jgi:immunoglobulin-binding protein 1
LASIDLAVINTRQNLGSIDVELELLSQRPLLQNPKPEEPGSGDDRLDRIPHSTLPKTGPILSGEGKVLRPFVLTSKRAEIGSGVFRPDHSLPTMSVEDYLTEEIRRGGILGAEEEASGNDRVKMGREEEEEEDREMEKRREWDDYAESHAKGSGNMGFNRG